MSGVWFDRQGREIDSAKANELLGDMEYRVVARHEESGYLVSTVWLGADHNFLGAGPPLLFESMIFGPEDWTGEYIERHPTEAAALAGHDQAVMHLRTEILGHREDEQDGQSRTPTAGSEVPNRPGRVVGDCGHPVWRTEWDGGERTCQPCQDAFAAEMSGGDQPLLLDPDCRDGKHGSCVGGLCECTCHEQDGGRSDG